MVDVLVAYASKMGSTAEIAEVIGAELRTAGLVVEVCPVTEVDSLAPYPEVVLGSAIYLRRWRPEAVRFLRRFTAQLLERRVWLFHSGPCGERDRHQPQPAPAQVRRLCRRIGADEPVTFGGLLDPSRARGVLARWMARGELAGDFRSWDEIRGWARSVGSQITPRDEEPPGRPSPDHR